MTILALTRTRGGQGGSVPARRAGRLTSALSSVLVLTAGVLGAGVLGATVPAGAAARAAAGAVRPGAAGRPGAATAGGLRYACAPVPAGYARCFAMFRPQTAVNRALAAGLGSKVSKPSGLTPRQIESAYRLPVSRNPHQTVAVVEAYNTPHLASWLYTYRKHFRLPSCTVRSGCLRVVNQRGKASPRPASAVPLGWDVETSLDVSMVSVACPHCHILVVEANTQRFGDLAKAENTAARLGATAISNSYGGREDGFTFAYRHFYSHRGHTIVASAGDSGFTAANFPADLATVTAVGGTELHKAHNKRGWTEDTWFAGGSGCSAYVAKPAWQHDKHCPGRTVADVSAVAWNVPVYDSFYGGWITVGGTSISSPLIAGIYALAGNARIVRPGYVYAHPRSLFDITKGNNSAFVTSKQACGNDYLCVAKKGYDAPTGLGTPNGTGSF
jgi:subtilase family serine protease